MDMTNSDNREVYRDKVHNLINAYYQPTFKTFYVNTTNGKDFIKPTGVFVSLGITTSKKTMDDIRVIVENHGYNARIAEISSIKDEGTGQYLNKLIEDSEDPEQYLLTEYNKDSIMDRDQSMEELGRLKGLLNPDQSLEVLKDISPKVSKLIDLINKLDPDGWNLHFIQKEDNGDYKIFHRYVNYKKVENTEYRIGIYVS